jgi:hypothetical protein
MSVQNFVSNTIAGIFETTAMLGIAAIATLFVYLSYTFELTAYENLLGDAFAGVVVPLLGVSLIAGIAICLNGAKLSITWLLATSPKQGIFRNLALKAIRVVIIINSVLMTLMVFSGELVDPKAEEVLANMNEVTAVRYESEKSAVNETFDAQEANLQLQVSRERQAIDKFHLPRLKNLEDLLTAERERGGKYFHGRRYKELLRLIEEQTLAYNTATDKLVSNEQSSLQALRRQRSAALETVAYVNENGVSSMSLKDVVGTVEAQNPQMVRFVATLTSLQENDRITPQTSSIVLTVLATILIELLPILLLHHVFRSAARVGTTRERPREKSAA